MEQRHVELDTIARGLFEPQTIAEASFRLRHQRRKIFGPDLCGFPAWDLMLMMFLARDRTVRLAEAANSLQLSETLIGRWLAILENRQIVKQDNDHENRSFELTDFGDRSVRRACSLLTVND